jgi:hypothetical protein
MDLRQLTHFLAVYEEAASVRRRAPLTVAGEKFVEYPGEELDAIDRRWRDLTA